MSQPFPANPFLIGHLAPISFEADAADLPIWGEVPKDLGGTLENSGAASPLDIRLSEVLRRKEMPSTAPAASAACCGASWNEGRFQGLGVILAAND